MIATRSPLARPSAVAAAGVLLATLCLGAGLGLGAGPAVADADDGGWTPRIDEDGLRVDIRVVDGSSFKAFRGEIVVPADTADVLARLRDIDRYPDWFPDTIEARHLGADNGHWANYVRTGAPWPVKDRDAIYVSTLQQSGDSLRIDVSADPDLAPEYDDAVRIRAAHGYWQLDPVAGGTRVLWEFHVEPGGSIPAGLANARVLSTPRDALLALREHFRGAGRLPGNQRR